MFYSPEEEARFELALSTSLLNEMKYGSHLSHLAEAMLLSAFRTSEVNATLHQQMTEALPAVRYVRCAGLQTVCTVCIVADLTCPTCSGNTLNLSMIYVQFGSVPQWRCGYQKYKSVDRRSSHNSCTGNGAVSCKGCCQAA